MDEEAPKHGYTLKCVSGSQSSSRFYIDRKGHDSAWASVCYLPLQTDWVREWPTEVSCNGDPRGSQSDPLQQLPDGPKLKSSVNLKSFFPFNWSLCSDEKGRKSAVALTLLHHSNQEVIYWKQTGLQQRTGILQAHSVNSILLFFFSWNFNAPPVGLQ